MATRRPGARRDDRIEVLKESMRKPAGEKSTKKTKKRTKKAARRGGRAR